jgi:hypothetical protein
VENNLFFSFDNCVADMQGLQSIGLCEDADVRRACPSFSASEEGASDVERLRCNTILGHTNNELWLFRSFGGPGMSQGSVPLCSFPLPHIAVPENVENVEIGLQRANDLLRKEGERARPGNWFQQHTDV